MFAGTGQVQAWRNRGYAAFYSNRHSYEEAVTSLDRSLAINPDDPRALAWRGMMAALRQPAEVAIQYYDRSLRADPSFTLAWVYKARALHRLQQYDEAMQSWDRAFLLGSEHWSERAEALTALGRLAEAALCWERARPRHASPRHWIERAALMERMGRLEEALDLYTTGLKDESSSAEDRLLLMKHLATLLISLGRLDEAKQFLVTLKRRRAAD